MMAGTLPGDTSTKAGASVAPDRGADVPPPWRPADRIARSLADAEAALAGIPALLAEARRFTEGAHACALSAERLRRRAGNPARMEALTSGLAATMKAHEAEHRKAAARLWRRIAGLRLLTFWRRVVLPLLLMLLVVVLVMLLAALVIAFWPAIMAFMHDLIARLAPPAITPAPP